MSVVETILIYAVIPLAVYGLFALLTLWSKFARGPRYRPGQDWDYPPVWWSANPAGSGIAAVTPSTDAKPSLTATARGGARGNW